MTTKTVCIVAPRKSLGAKDLVKALKSLGVNVLRSESSKPGCLNIGWGKPGGDLNPKLPPNKFWELAKCAKANIPVVPVYREWSAAIAEASKFKPMRAVWGRKLNHTKGRDIIRSLPLPNPYKGNKIEYWRSEPRDFYTLEIPKRNEYRVHVFLGLAVRSGSKLRPDGTKGKPEEIWNTDKGFQIRYEHPAPKSAKNIAKAAVKACGLDFAAVDILEDLDGKCYVLEVNTRPGLHGNTCLKYAEKIKLLAEGKIDRVTED